MEWRVHPGRCMFPVVLWQSWKIGWSGTRERDAAPNKRGKNGKLCVTPRRILLPRELKDAFKTMTKWGKEKCERGGTPI